MRADFENEETGDLVRNTWAPCKVTACITQLFHAIRDYTADALGGAYGAQTTAGGGLYARRIVTRLRYDLEAASAKRWNPQVSATIQRAAQPSRRRARGSGAR